MTLSLKADLPATALRWRYATKKFDTNKKISEETWTEIEDALVLTPSSYGLQPWKFVVITNQALKEQLVPATMNQTQPAECSHFVVICRLKEMTEGHIDSFLARTSSVRNSDIAKTAPFRNLLVDFVAAKSPEELSVWMTKQCYIALGNLMTSASFLGVDNCPMEGFSSKQYDEILDLSAIGVTSVVCCALGYRNEDDKYGKMNKVRFDNSEIIVKK